MALLGKSRQQTHNSRRVSRYKKHFAYDRRLRVEGLEDRRMLANSSILDFAQSIGGTENDTAYDLTRDGAGNIYVAGEFSGSVDFDPGPGVYVLDSPADPTGSDPSRISESFIAKYTANGDFVWATKLGMQYGYAQFGGVAVDGSGNVFAAGYMSGSDGDLLQPGDNDVVGVLVKFDSMGNESWAQIYGSTLFDQFVGINDLVADDSGNVTMAGYYSGTVDFDTGSGAAVLTSPGDESGFVAKMNSNGNLLWARNVASDGFLRVNQLCLDSAGSLVATGQFSGTTDFDPGPDVFEVPADGGGFLLMLDQSGAFTWVRTIDSAQVDGLAIDSQDNIVASGIFQGTTDFDPGSGIFELTPSGSGPHSGFVWKLDSTGNFLWARAPDGGIGSTAYRVAVDSADDVYVVGNYFGRTDMDPGLGTYYLEEPGGGDYVWKLDSAGNFAWARSSNADENYAGVAVDNSGIVYLAPTFTNSVDFDPGPQDLVLTSQGNADFAIVRLSQGVVVPVNADTIIVDLQSTMSNILSTTTGSGASPPKVVLAVDNSVLDAVVAAVEALAANVGGPVVTIVVNLAAGAYSGNDVDVPVGVRLVINGDGGPVTFVGASPAFTVSSGDVEITGVAFTNSTDAPTILVTGGSLVLRDSFVEETTGGSRAAIEITGGTVDLGTAADPGGNTITVNGSGEFISNTSVDAVPAFGDEFQTDSVTISASFMVGLQQRLIFDAGSSQLALASTVIHVGIDFGQSSLNIDQNGSLSLVIFGSSLFDASQVNAGSLRLAGVAIDVFNQSLHDANHDGQADLKIHFRTSAALKAALTDLYSDALLDDYADDEHYASKQDILLSLDGAFGALGQEFHGADSTNLFLSGKSLKSLLTSLGI